MPIFCLTVAEREFVAREPDAGTVFVWVGKSLGPRLGWIASWALLAATLRYGSSGIVAQMLEHGANVTATDLDGWTPLTRAAESTLRR